MKQCYQFNEDNEWYTQEIDIIHFLDRAGICKSKVIWCPFDKDDSNFVKVLRLAGYEVINSHIDYGQDFYEYEPNQHYDIILSNPPFKNKSKLIGRLIQLNKPFGLIFGIQCFNTGKFTRLLGLLNKLQVVFLERRIAFVKDVNEKNPPARPTFHSMWICNDLLEKDINIW